VIPSQSQAQAPRQERLHVVIETTCQEHSGKRNNSGTRAESRERGAGKSQKSEIRGHGVKVAGEKGSEIGSQEKAWTTDHASKHPANFPR
jgi:hypothetical protein